MYEQTKEGLGEARARAREATTTLRNTNRTALRNYLTAAFTLQRAGIEAVDALQRGAEELTFNLLDRGEGTQQKMMDEAELRLRESATRLREARARIQARLREEQGELEEGGERAEGRLREGAEIAIKVARVMESRVETMLTELLDLGRRELNEIEERVESLVDRLDRELEEEIHPIPSYDDRTAEEIIAAFDGLDAMQLRTVRAYEVNHKNRVTVLRAVDETLAQRDELTTASGRQAMANKVERLAEKRAATLVETMPLPIEGYDEMNAQEVDGALAGLSGAELGAVRAYELANKNRVTVLRALDDRLAALGADATPA